MLQLLEKKFTVTRINILKATMEKMDKVQDQVGDFLREKETLRKTKKKILKIKTKIIEMKNAFDGLISGLVITKEIVCELE